MKAYTPFDDSQQKDRRRATADASSDVSAYAAHRQGVENTLPSHYAAGIVKIHDGYNDQDGNHGVVQLVLGQEKVGIDGAVRRSSGWRETSLGSNGEINALLLMLGVGGTNVG